LSKGKRRQRKDGENPSKAASAPAPPAGQGFDFGIEIRALLFSDVSFLEYLQQAHIVACGYGGIPTGPLGAPMFVVSLVGINPEALTKAFAEFKRWAASGDGDTVELTFIFLRKTGYILSICREHTRGTRDLLGSDRASSPIFLEVIYNKRFDTRDVVLDKFREYKTKNLISPFLLGAATVNASATATVSMEQVEPLLGVEPILKFEAAFVDEESVEPGSTWHSIIVSSRHDRSSGRRKTRSGLPSPPKPSQHPQEHFRYRARFLNRHFPVTIERIRTGRYPDIMTTFRENGVKDWQAEQAVANLLLSARICNGRRFYGDIREEDLAREISQAIQQYEERSDTVEALQFSMDDIVRQVQLDSVALLGAEGYRFSGSSGLDESQKRLARLGLLLEPQNA
jgi:hypothetical protein